jgi:hypothetical protein
MQLRLDFLKNNGMADEVKKYVYNAVRLYLAVSHNCSKTPLVKTVFYGITY